MKNEMLQQAAEYRKKHKRKTFWYQVVSCMAAVVVFCTTYALILPAITMEKQAICGIEEHTHDDSCYEAELICSPVTHTHTGSCYDTSGMLICGIADYVIHTHSDDCYNTVGELVCALNEVNTHIHDSNCYAKGTDKPHRHEESCYTSKQGELICQESTEPHAHTDSCYTQKTKLVCVQEESQGHTHGEGCTETKNTLICTVTEHSHIDTCLEPESGSYICGLGEHEHVDGCYSVETVSVCTITPSDGHSHTDDCYETVSEITCTKSTTESHIHADACYEWTLELTCGYEEEAEDFEPSSTESAEPVLVCTKAEIFVHRHSSDCYGVDGLLICGLLETFEHSHSNACYAPVEPDANPELICQLPEHMHDKVLCYSDTTADVEDESDWEKTLPETLTGKWDEDIVAVAMSQLDYAESARNVQVGADGRIWGYSRYGDWYGDPYGEWNATFVSFCLHYAEIDFPALESSAHRMVKTLMEKDLFTESHEPRPGDLVFLSDDADDEFDRVAIVKEITEDELTTIQGDTENNCVETVVYELTDPLILGYYIMPEAPDIPETQEIPDETTQPEIIYYCGQEEHTHGEDCYDAEDKLICEQLEHLHTNVCTTEPEEATYFCGIEAHAHEEACYDAEGNLSCELTAHAHTEACSIEPTVYYCSKEEHTHGEDCNDEESNLICELEEHTHNEECLTGPAYHCGKEEHTHSEECCDIDGNLVCDREEHTHNAACSELTGEALTRVEAVIAAIDAMPSAEEIDAKVAQFQEQGDEDGETAYLEEVYAQVQQVYWQFKELGEDLQQYVANADKLLELEYIWSAEMFDTYTTSPTIYQINSYEYSWSAGATMAHGGTVGSALGVSWEFVNWIGVIVEEDGSGNLYVAQIADSGTNKNSLKADTANGFVLLFADEFSEKPTVSVGDIVTVDASIPAKGALKYNSSTGNVSGGYGQVHFSSEVKPITSAAPTPVKTASTKDFVELNLYDYNGYVNANYWSKNTWYPGFQWNGGAYSKTGNYGYRDSYTYSGIGIPYAVTDRNYIDSIDFGNSLITNLYYGYGASGNYTKAINATAVGYADKTKAHPINWLYGNSTEGYTNKPIGYSTTDLTETQNVMKYTLVNGYPALTDGTSLDYLFKNGTPAKKLNTQSIDGLFQVNPVSGLYYYNSRENHAQYANNQFTVYAQKLTPNFITYPFGNFLPLNSITDSSKATQVGAFSRSGGMRDYVERLLSDLDSNAEGLDANWKSSQDQLATMLEEYKENWLLYPRTLNGTLNTWTNLSPANAIRDYFIGDSDGNGDNPSDNTDFISQPFLDDLYNIDWDVQTNFFFGMEMKMTVMMPKDGMTGKDNGNNSAGWETTADGTFVRTGEPDGIPDYPMVFNFSGDDDVWVYIDDVLFLDLSGIHRHVGGTIDFQTGNVYYFELTPATGDTNQYDPGTSKYYKKFTFAEILTAAGRDTSALNSNGTFKDYSTHTFNFYYMERGSGSSVCRINFNFPMLRKNSISVSKENLLINDTTGVNGAVEGNPDYYFNIVTSSNELFVGPGSKTEITEYKVMDSSGNFIKDPNGNEVTYQTDEYGIFTLKAGQTAVFEGIDENKGDFFVQELIKAEDNEQYPEVYINDVASRYNELVDWQYRKYFSKIETPDKANPMYTGPYGYQWYGRSGQETDSSSNSTFYFEQQNHVDVSKLGSLSLTKQVDSYTAPLADTYYRMYVMLDDQPLAKDMKLAVSVDGTNIRDAIVSHETVDGKTVSYVEIARGETVKIPNIISGTRFKVWESAASANGFDVVYSATNADGLETGTTSISGIVRVNTDVVVTITNSENGTQLEIPFTKSFRQFTEGTYRYTFTLTETDASGNKLDGGLTVTKEVDVNANNAVFTFDPIVYLANQFDGDSAKRYYLIEETSVGETSLPNDQQFLVEVTLTRNQDASITADVTKVSEKTGDTWTEVINKTVTFTNTLTGDLSLEKKLEGVNNNQLFGFIIKLAKGSSNVENLPKVYTSTAYNPDGTVQTDNLVLNFGDDYEFHIAMKHGEKLVIHGIPIGAQWTILEGTAQSDENGDFTGVDPAAPDGYIVSNKVGEGTVTEGNESTGSIVANGTKVEYTNTSTYVLPETGGTGTIPYTMAGLMLMLLSAAYLLYNTKKRRREVN